jgi:hypothetical protein
MATKKIKKTSAKKIKPEMVYTALPRKAIKPKPAKKPQKKKVHKKHQPTKAEQRTQNRMVRRALGACISLILLIVALYILTGLFKLERIFDESIRTTEVLNSIDKDAAAKARIAGSNSALQAQIVNFQSAPQDLQSFITQDYRNFKNSCIVNGQISPDVGYEVVAVVYDSFAKVARTCGGTTTALLKRFESGWTEVFSGNVPPACSLVNDLAIPKGLAATCVEQGASYQNPNP